MASEKNISGIAMNERLNDAGLLDDFYKAANKKDRNKMIALLMSVGLERSQAEETSDTILNNPAFN
jgi:hypothetical protein